MPTEMKTEPSRVATPDGLRKRINALYTHLKAFIEDKGNPGFERCGRNGKAGSVISSS